MTELVLGDRVDCFSLLERQVVASPVVERHFPSVLSSLVGDARRITCPFIALSLDIHVFYLRPEAEGAVLHTTRMVCRMRSEFIQVCGRGQNVKVATPLQGVRLSSSRRV